MGPIEDLKKIKRFDEIEKLILSSEVDGLTINQLQKYQRELSLNIPQLEESKYYPKLNILNSTISSKINDIVTKENRVMASKRFWWPFLLGVATALLGVLTLYLSFFH